MRHFSAIGLLFLLLLPVATSAQSGIDAPTSAACLQDMYRAFGREHRLARAVVFGQPSADDAPTASVFYDATGNAWVKTDDNTWKSAVEGADASRTDDQMNDQRERDLLCENNDDPLQRSCVLLPRRGILETQGTPTSDVIHPLVQSIRALQCRLRAVCDVARLSPGKEEGALITVAPDGCLSMTYPVFEGCRTADENVFETIPGNCQQARRQLVQREMQLLTLAVSYDASYRSLAQFSGMFQEFLLQFRFPLIEPLWQAMRTLGGLRGIPCFQAECNE